MPATVNAGGPVIGPIAEAVIATHRLDADVSFCERLGWVAGPAEQVSVESAARWRSPGTAGARTIAAGPPAGAPGAGVRFVEADPPPAAVVPLTTYGWAAIEIIVADVDALAADLDGAGIEVLGRPAAVGDVSPRRGRRPGRAAGLRAMQIALPGGAPVYLTEISNAPDGFHLPRIDLGIGGVCIVVVASPDLETTRRFLESRFALRRVTDHPLAVGVLNRAFELRPTTRHRVSSLQLAGDAVIEIDQYPPGASPRPVRRGELPHGVAVVEVHATRPPRVDLGRVDGPFGLCLAVVSPAT